MRQSLTVSEPAPCCWIPPPEPPLVVLDHAVSDGPVDRVNSTAASRRVAAGQSESLEHRRALGATTARAAESRNSPARRGRRIDDRRLGTLDGLHRDPAEGDPLLVGAGLDQDGVSDLRILDRALNARVTTSFLADAQRVRRHGGAGKDRQRNGEREKTGSSAVARSSTSGNPHEESPRVRFDSDDGHVICLSSKSARGARRRNGANPSHDRVSQGV